LEKDILFFIALVLELMTITWIFGYFLVMAYGAIALLAVGVLSMFYPLISAIITNRYFTKMTLGELNVKPRFLFVLVPLILVFFYPFLVIYIGAIIASPFIPVDWYASTLISGMQKAIRDATGIEVSVETIIIMLAFSYLFSSLVNSIPAYGEEAGWRGFLWTRLKQSYSLEEALVIMGVVWGVWHWPLYTAANLIKKTPIHILIPFLLEFVLFTTGISVFLVWLVEKTNSVLYPSIAHGAINAGLGFGYYVVLVDDPLIGFNSGIIPIIAIWIIAFFCYLDLKKMEI